MREREVWASLDAVTDPELDEPITDMGFVEAVSVGEGGEVLVTFRLPTYWCSPNFAFLMAEGIRREVGRLPWAARVDVRLEDHLCAAEINGAVNEGGSFSDAFALRPDGGDLAEVRRTFDEKAFQRRQEAVLLALRAEGFTPAMLATMTLEDLDRVVLEGPESPRQRDRYREMLLRLGLAATPADHAFPDLGGDVLTERSYVPRMGTLRAVRINMEFGGALCRGLKQSRYKEAVAVDAEPTLIDFVLDRVPLRTASG